MRVLQFEPKLGETDIAHVKISTKSRDDIPQILLGLQYIYMDKEIMSEIEVALNRLIPENVDAKNGRPGMALWRIFVLSVLRLGLNCDYDRLEELANEHNTLRKMLGHGPFDEQQYTAKTLKNNLSLFTPEVLEEINTIVVKSGHKLVKKKVDDDLSVRCDSFVVEMDVHFPTDNSLIYDAGRKILTLSAELASKYHIEGYRQIKHNIKVMKQISVCIAKIKRGAPKSDKTKLTKEKKLKGYYKDLMERVQNIVERAEATIQSIENCEVKEEKIHKKLIEYIGYAKTFISQINRRVFEGKIIPQEEKIFSIFEPEVEWICKGKAKAPIELGKRVAIVEDQYQFTLHHLVMHKEVDEKVAKKLIEEAKSKFPNIISASFDKGFYSKSNFEELSKMLPFVVLPKKGKLSKEQQEIESSKEFGKARRQHSAVESAINCLEVHGLDRCLDSGINGFKRYIALGIVSANIHRVGRLIKIREEEALKHRLKLLLKAA